MKKYLSYILIVIIIILIIIIGLFYSKQTTEKVVTKEIEIKEEKEKIPEVKKIYIDIKGEVEHPDVYELNENERVIDAIKKAGGLTDKASTDNLNLSKILKDEMVIIVYNKDEIKEYEEKLNNKEKVKEIIKYEIIEKPIPCPNTTNEACINKSNNTEEKETTKEKESVDKEPEETILVNINTASKEELLTVPGIGETKADSIIEYRENAEFTTIEDIKNVKGIGNSLFEKIKTYITI